VGTTVAVAGALANKTGNGGEAWVRMSWVSGLRRLGFDVVFVEEIDPGHCLDAVGKVVGFEDSANLAYFDQVTAQFDLVGSAALVYDGGAKIAGSTRSELLARIDGAALLVNISGHLRTEWLLRPFTMRTFVDIDPCFTQVWHADPAISARLGGHDLYFTIGENIGTGHCSVPTADVRWLPTRQPVVLDDWAPNERQSSTNRFTTVATWRGPYGPLEYRDTTYGLKVHQFRRFAELPKHSPHTFELALAFDPADAGDIAMLIQKGWEVVDPRLVASDPTAFRSYVQGSSAEFSCAQGVYVETDSGWFSDRTTRYLASGRPAVVQDTGFGRNLPVGEGLLAFRSTKEARRAVDDVAADYERHARAARALAEQEFDSDKVLGRFLEAVGVAP
jgi:hypothetical protein